MNLFLLHSDHFSLEKGTSVLIFGSLKIPQAATAQVPCPLRKAILDHILKLASKEPMGWEFAMLKRSDFAGKEKIRKAPGTFNFLRHVMRAILSVRPKCSHRCASLKETPLKPVQILKHTTNNSAEQTAMRTKWFKHIAI